MSNPKNNLNNDVGKNKKLDINYQELVISNDPYFSISASDLTKHIFIFGSTGSGKTVLSKAIIEEISLKEIPTILIDSQGDLVSLKLPKPIEDLKGLEDYKGVYNHFNKNVRLYSPSGRFGSLISIPFIKEVKDELDIEAISTSIVNLLKASRPKYDLYKAVLNIIFKEILLSGNMKNNELKISNLNDLVNTIEALTSSHNEISQKLSAIISGKELKRFIRELKIALLNNSILNQNSDFNMNDLFKNLINVIYIKDLSDTQREFFLALLLSNLYWWSINNPKDINFLLFIDEVARFIPAGNIKSPVKDVLLRLIKEGRKFGVGVMLSTQNPGDIDYKAFAQFNTLAVGRITTKQDYSKIKDLIDIELKYLSSLKPGEFYIINKSKSLKVKVRDLYTIHKTLSEDKIKELFGAYNKRLKEESKSNKTKKLNLYKSIIKIFPITFTKEWLLKTVEKHRKKIFSRELLNEIILRLYPINRIKLICKSLLGLNEYYVFVNSYSGKIINMNSFEVFDFSKLWTLSEFELLLLAVMKNSKKTLSELNKKISKPKQIISKSLNNLKSREIIVNIKDKYQSLVKIPSYKALTSDINIYDIDFINEIKDEFNIKLMNPKFKDFKALKILYEKCDLSNTADFLLPVYEIKYESKNKTRSIFIIGYKGKILKEDL